MEMNGGLKGKIIALALLSLLLVSCGNNEGVSQDPSTDSIPEGFALITGKVAITGEVQQADIYAMGQEALGVKTDADGNFSLLVECDTSGTAASASATASERHLLIFHNQDSTYGLTRDIQVTEGGAHEINDVVLLPTGSIMGNVTLQGQVDHSGITVYLPGTSYIAMTDASGNFTITGVPEGTYDFLRADYTGYHHAITLNVAVTSSLSTTIENQEMLLSTGASGQIAIESGAEFTSSLDVTLTVGATENAVLMMISENISFMGASWQPIQSLIPYTFPSEGQNTIYIKFADANGLESGTFADSIYIDANPAVNRISPVSMTNETMPTLVWEYAAPMQNPAYHVQVASDEAFTQIFIDQSGLANPEYTFSNPLQNLATYHWRVAIIDDSGFEWSMAGPWSFTVNLDTVTLVAPANLSTADIFTPTFTWQPNAAAASYVLTLSGSPDLSGGVNFATSATTYTLSTPLPDVAPAAYYWAVTPVDGNGVQGTRSDIWSFVLHTGLLVSDIAFPDNNLRNCVLATGATYADEIAVLHCGLSGISSLSGIEHLTNLSELDLQHNNISDITPLAGLTNLQALALNNNVISDVTALSGLTRLFNLHLENNNITDVSALSGLTEMISLYLGYNSIANVSPLSGFPVLFDLHLDNNIITAGVADLVTLPLTSWIYLAGNNGIPCADLQVLIDTFGAVQVKAPSICSGGRVLVSDIVFPDNNLRNCVLATGAAYADEIAVLHCGLSGISSLSGIEHLTNLSELDLQHNNISNITPLSGLTNLQGLSLNNNLISDVTALSGMTRLTTLYLRNNNITDVAALAGLTKIISLDLNNNSIANVSPLSGFRVIFSLQLDNNVITGGVADLVTLPSTAWIYLTGNDNIPCADLQVLFNKFGSVQVKAPATCI